MGPISPLQTNVVCSRNPEQPGQPLESILLAHKVISSLPLLLAGQPFTCLEWEPCMFEEGASPGAHLELGARLTVVEEWAPSPSYLHIILLFLPCWRPGLCGWGRMGAGKAGPRAVAANFNGHIVSSGLQWGGRQGLAEWGICAC